MRITIYADVLFFTNLLANLFLLICTKKLTKNKAHFWRLLAGALLGSLYAVLLFFPTLSILQSLLCRLLTLLAILCTSFRFCSVKQFLHCVLWFFIVHLLTGGLCYALFFMTHLGIQTGTICSNGIFYWHVPAYMVMLAFLCAYALLQAFDKLCTLYRARRQNLYTLSITLGAETITLSALLDTGNALYDPCTSLPVVIAEKGAFSLAVTPTHPIPYRTLAGKIHTLQSIRPDSIAIDGKTAPACMLAFTDAKLSYDGQFQALLHSALIQGGSHEHVAKITQDKQTAI